MRRMSRSLTVCGKPGNLSFCRSGMELCAGSSVVWLGIKGSFSFLYGVRLCGNQFRDADQVVGDEVQQESSGDTSNPAMLSLAHRAMLLAPAKDAFDHFAALLRHAIARVPCRAGIDRASPPLADFGRAIVLRHMRRDVDGTQVFNMALRIIGLVRACRDAMTNGLALGFQHGLRGAPFRRAIGLCDDPCHRKPVPVLHGDMTHVAEPRLPPRRLAIETALRIGRARMRLVRAFLAAKIRAVSFIVAAVLGPNALLRRPGLDQSPIHRKMLVRQKRLHLRVIQKLRHELLKHVALLQPFAVLGEGRRVPYRIVRGKPGEPAIQKVVVELLHQLPFRADPIEDLQQQGTQQLLRRNRRASLTRIKLSEIDAEFLQHRSNELPDLPQWMPRRYPRLWREVGKQSTLVPKSPAHGASTDS